MVGYLHYGEANVPFTVLKRYQEYSHKTEGVNLLVNIYFNFVKLISSYFNAYTG